MSLQALHRAPLSRTPTSLAVRAGLARTFGALAAFLAISFLCSGIYILEDFFANPIAAQATALISGASIIALATILLFYLLKPGNKPKRSSRESHHRNVLQSGAEFGKELSLPTSSERSRKDLSHQRFTSITCRSGPDAGLR